MLAVRTSLLVLALVAGALLPASAAAAAHVVVVDADGAADEVSCAATSPAPRTVTAALAEVATGGTIRVCPGTVVEPGQVVVGRDVTVRAFDPDEPPVLRPAQDTGTVGDDRGWWLVRPGAAFALRDVHLDGDGRLLHQAVRFRGQGWIRDVTFTDIGYHPSGPDRSGFAVVAFGDGPVSVIGSTFRRIGRVGALFYGTATAGSLFDDNRYVGKGAGDHLDYGVEVGAGSDVTVRDSTISRARGEADGAVSAAVLVSTAFGSGSAVAVTGSALVDNAHGVFVDDASGRGMGPVTVARNRIEGSTVLGVARVGSRPVDVTCNWWGASDGPRTGGGSGDAVANGLDPTPFLTSPDLRGRCASEPLMTTDDATVVVDEGSTVTVTGTFDAGTSTPVSVSASTGTVRTEGSNHGTWAWTATPDDGPLDSGTVTLTGDNGARATVALELLVRNVAPSGRFQAPGTAFTDRPFGLALRDVTDPSRADRAAGFRIQFDCGDGAGYRVASVQTEVACEVPRGGRRTVRALVADRDGGSRDYTAVVEVHSPDGDGSPDRSAAGTAAPRGVIATGDGEATASDPIVTRVRVPSGGEVTIEEGPPAGPVPADHELLTWGSTVTAPRQVSESPLEVTFRLDADVLPDPIPGTGTVMVAPVLGGELVPPCGPTGDAAGSRLPCVSRHGVTGDDLLVSVRTTGGGPFAFAVPVRACPGIGVPASPFRDVDGTAHEAAVACARWWEVVRGTGPDRYQPTGAVSRAQLASMVARLLSLAGVALPLEPADPFTDVGGSVHEVAIRQLAQLGVLEGRTETRFAPAAAVTRGQFASILARTHAVLLDEALAAGPDGFHDDDGTVHEPSIDAAAAAGLTDGVGDGRFAPHASVRRDQTASFLTRLLDAWYVDRRR